MIWVQIYTFPLKAKNNSPTKIIIRTNNLFRTTDLTDLTDDSTHIIIYIQRIERKKIFSPQKEKKHDFVLWIGRKSVPLHFPFKRRMSKINNQKPVADMITILEKEEMKETAQDARRALSLERNQLGETIEKVNGLLRVLEAAKKLQAENDKLYEALRQG
jgi:hypothetical protein